MKTLVSIVGREGAISALETSKLITVKDLIHLAKSLNLGIKSQNTKKMLAMQMVRHVDKRITKSLDELKLMSKAELLQYFEQVACDKDELIELLNSIDFKTRVKSRRSILEFAANQIHSLGIFERLAAR